MTTAVGTIAKASGYAPFATTVNALSSFLTVGDITTARADWTCTGVLADGALVTLEAKHGFCASFKFLLPGTYTITLTVTDHAGGTSSTQAIVPAFDFDTIVGGKTYHVANEGDDTTGTGSRDLPFKTPYKALNVMIAASVNDVAANSRILFKAQQIHVVPLGAVQHNTFNKRTGPILIGRYGDGANPLVHDQRDPLTNPITFHLNGGRMSGWSFVDVDFKGSYVPGVTPISVTGKFFRVLFDSDMASGPYDRADLLFSGCTVQNYGQSWMVETDAAGQQGVNIGKTGNVVVDGCTFKDAADIHLYCYLRDSAIVNTQCLGTDGSHVVRIPVAQRVSLWNLTAKDPNRLVGNGRHALKLHGGGIGAPSGSQWGRTEDVWITGGTYRGSNITMAIEPQNGSSNEEIARVIVDGVTFEPDQSVHAGNHTDYAVCVVAHDVVIRNCAFKVASGASWPICPRSYPSLVVPVTTLRVLHCTARAEISGAQFALLRPDNLVSSAVVHAFNNALSSTTGVCRLADFISSFDVGNIVDDGNVCTPAATTYVTHGSGSYTFAQWQALAKAANSRNGLTPDYLDPANAASPLISAISQYKIGGIATALNDCRYDFLNRQRTDSPIVGAHANQEDGGSGGGPALDDSIAEQIVQNIVDTIETITQAAGYANDIATSAGGGGAQRVDDEGEGVILAKSPTVIVSDGQEVKDDSPEDSDLYFNELVVVLRVAARRPTDLVGSTSRYIDSLVRDIEKALRVDPKRGRPADVGDTVLHGHEKYSIQREDGGLELGADITLTVDYLHRRGDPRLGVNDAP